MKKLKIGLIGVGHMGQYHLNILSNMESIEFIGMSDKNTERLEDLSEKYEVKGYDDFRKLAKKCDAVCIATPTKTHYEVAIECLDMGKHVLLEKPMTTSIKEARELVDAARKKNLILQIGHVERFNGAVQQLKKIIVNPFYIETQRTGPFNPRISDVGVVLDLMIHDLDIVLNLIDEEVTDYSAFGKSVFSKFEDIASAHIRFQSGAFANIMASRASQKKIRTLTIMQKESFIYLDYATQDIEIHRQASTAYLLTPEEIRYSQESFVEHLFIHKENSLKFEDMHFINSILEKEEPFVSNEKDLQTLEVTLNIEKLIKDKMH